MLWIYIGGCLILTILFLAFNHGAHKNDPED
jgi:hypothetical protein